MLRDLGKAGAVRQGEIDPNDSVFLVLLWFERDERTHYEVGYCALGLGEAQAAAERFAREGSAIHGHEFNFATVVEYQTGQLAPKGERHGQPYVRESVQPPSEADEIARMRLEINQLRARLGQSQETQVT